MAYREARTESLDQEALGRLRRTMGSEAEFRDMLAEFLSASQRLAVELGQSRKSGRVVDAERVVHTLKSMARMVGAFELAEACATAEAMAAGGNLPATDEIAHHLAQAQEAVRSCLA